MKLTARQEQVARLISAGMTRSRIASELGISVSSVDKTTRVLKTKLGAQHQTELVVRCNRHFIEAGKASSGPTTGKLNRLEINAPPAGEDPVSAFSEAEDFDRLFEALVVRLQPFRITHITYSHITLDDLSGSVQHLATRWSFPEEVTFDLSIPPEENFAFKHAMASWEPAPLDLEELARSDLYSYLPANIRAQNEVFLDARLCRGVTYVLPGIKSADRLVISVLMQDATRAQFETFVSEKIDSVYRLLMQFRNAHANMAKPSVRLTRDERTVMDAFCRGETATEISRAMDISRRAVDRILQQVRIAYGVPNNAAAASSYIRDNVTPPLPF